MAATLPARRCPPDADALPADEADRVRTFKLALNDALDDLRRAQRAAAARSLANTLDEHQLDRFRDVSDASLLVVAEPADYVDAVSAFLERRCCARVTGRERHRGARGRRLAGRLLEAYDARFETFDQVVLPLAYPDLGEVNAVELWRVSPRDAPGTVPEQLKDPVEKLAGLRLHHFGAFLDEAYRENDLLWGRLDGAEAIMRAVLPDPGQEALRDRFRIAAQAAILREGLPERLRPTRDELREPGEATTTPRRSLPRAYTPPPELDAARRGARRPGPRDRRAGAGQGREEAPCPKLPLTLLGHGGPMFVRVARFRRLNPFRRRR